ncbi:MAG TPA: hypothetical protein VF515_15595 [Candidatus Binatia bacterium]
MGIAKRLALILRTGSVAATHNDLSFAAALRMPARANADSAPARVVTGTWLSDN